MWKKEVVTDTAGTRNKARPKNTSTAVRVAVAKEKTVTNRQDTRNTASPKSTMAAAETNQEQQVLDITKDQCMAHIRECLNNKNPIRLNSAMPRAAEPKCPALGTNHRMDTLSTSNISREREQQQEPTEWIQPCQPLVEGQRHLIATLLYPRNIQITPAWA